MQVSRLGLGSGGHNVFGQTTGVPEAEIHRLVHRALDLGINLFDTAPDYLDSESILGRALQGVPRDRYLLSSKVTLATGGPAQWIASPQETVKSVEASLRRLRVPELDILLMGGFLTATNLERVVADLVPALQRLQAQGKVRYLGASEKSSDDGAHEWLQAILATNLVDVVMVAYNLINQSAERFVFPLCRQEDVGVMAIYTVRNTFSRRERLEEVIADLKRRGLLASDAVSDTDPLGWLLQGEEGSLVDVAYRFAAGNDTVSAIMTGTINPEHLEENVKTIERPPLPEEKIARLRRVFGHIAEPIGN